jgi:hypothetical protein
LEHVSDCSACATGTFSTGGSSNCSRCDAGSYSTGNGSNCAPCEAGYMCTNGVRSACSNLGEYQDLGGQSNCKPINGGYYKVNDSNIAGCPAGYKCIGNGEMTPCSAQSNYQPSEGQSNCVPIDGGYYKVDYSNIAQCPAGSYGTGGTCTPCGFIEITDSYSSESYQNQIGQTECLPCTCSASIQARFEKIANADKTGCIRRLHPTTSTPSTPTCSR